MDNHLIERLLRINEHITEALWWSVDQKKADTAVRLLPIAEAFANVLADISDKDARKFIRRKTISIVRKHDSLKIL